jgi:hypothetical protein
LRQTLEYVRLFSGWLTQMPLLASHVTEEGFTAAAQVSTPALIDMCPYQVRGLMRT